MGVVAVGIFTVTAALVFWGLRRVTVGIPVSAEEETEGLDLGEHKISAYPEFHTAGAHGVAAGVTATATAPAARIGVPAAERGR
jgi:Amt family ammonium transporter